MIKKLMVFCLCLFSCFFLVLVSHTFAASDAATFEWTINNPAYVKAYSTHDIAITALGNPGTSSTNTFGPQKVFYSNGQCNITTDGSSPSGNVATLAAEIKNFDGTHYGYSELETEFDIAVTTPAGGNTMAATLVDGTPAALESFAPQAYAYGNGQIHMQITVTATSATEATGVDVAGDYTCTVVFTCASLL